MLFSNIKKQSHRHIIPLLLVGVIICSIGSASAARLGSEPTGVSVAPERNYERETMTFPAQKKRSKSAQTEENTKKPAEPKNSTLTNSIVPMIVMGVIVLGIFLWIGLSIVKKLLPGGKKLFSTPGLEILGKTHFDSQKYMAIVRVGTRVLVVGVSQNGFDQISEITDPEEVTEILSSAKPKTSTGQNLFYKMFQKQINKQESTISGSKKGVAEPLASPSPANTRSAETDETEHDLLERQERIKKIRDLES